MLGEFRAGSPTCGCLSVSHHLLLAHCAHRGTGTAPAQISRPTCLESQFLDFGLGMKAQNGVAARLKLWNNQGRVSRSPTKRALFSHPQRRVTFDRKSENKDARLRTSHVFQQFNFNEALAQLVRYSVCGQEQARKKRISTHIKHVHVHKCWAAYCAQIDGPEQRLHPHHSPDKPL
jgi:hypothetical protein